MADRNTHTQSTSRGSVWPSTYTQHAHPREHIQHFVTGVWYSLEFHKNYNVRCWEALSHDDLHKNTLSILLWKFSKKIDYFSSFYCPYKNSVFIFNLLSLFSSALYEFRCGTVCSVSHAALAERSPYSFEKSVTCSSLLLPRESTSYVLRIYS